MTRTGRGPRTDRPARIAVRIAVRAAAALCGLLVLGAALAPPASAHAVLVSSVPVDGARVGVQPAAVRLRFDESVGLLPSSEEVIATDGVRADTGRAHLTEEGTTIVLPLRPHLPRGTYSAIWRVVSADTHIVSGSITFGLGVEPGAGAAAPVDRTGQLDVAADVAQGVVYGGLVLLVGVGAALEVVWPRLRRSARVPALAWTGWLCLVVGTAALLVLEGPRAANGSWSAAAHLDGLGQTVGSTFGRQLLARLALLVVLAPALTRWGRDRLGGRRGRWVLGAAGLALLAAVAVTGHEAVGEGVAIALPSAVVHLAAMSLWVGGLVLLGVVVAPQLRRGELAAVDVGILRWSTAAYMCVAALVVTGEYQAYRQISPLGALWSTRYGVLLLVKVALVTLMLGAAYAAQRHLVVRATRTTAPSGLPAAGRPGRPAGTTSGAPARAFLRALRRTVAIELAVAVAVLAVTAVLVSEPPARTTYGPATTLAAPLGPDHVTVALDTTRHGPASFDVRVLSASGVPARTQTVTATLSSASVASLAVRLVRSAPDGSRWVSRDAVIPLAGAWTLNLDVALDSTDAYATSATFRAW